MTKKQLLRSIAFCIVVCLLLVFLCDLFENEETKNYSARINTYHMSSEGLADAVFIGTSGVDRYWIGPQAYEEYGMTVYPLSSDALPAWLYVDMVDFALEYQDPEMIILDTRAFCQGSDAEYMDVCARRVLDAMPRFSPMWFQIAFKCMDVIHSVDPTRPRFDISFLLSFVRFHPAWQDAGPTYLKNSFFERTHKYGGFYMSNMLTPLVVPQEPFEYDDTVMLPLDPLSEASLREVVAYVREKGLQLLVVDTPQFFQDDEMGLMNSIYALLDELEVEYVHYYQTGEDGPFAIDLDPEKDFYNLGHVNFYGAEKFTDVLAAYLDENYDLPDRRNDPQAQKHWDGVYDRLLAKAKDYIANPYIPEPEDDEAALD